MKLFTIVLMEALSLPFVCNNWQVLVWTGHDIHLTSSPSAFKSSMPNTFSNELCPKGVIVTSYYNFLTNILWDSNVKICSLSNGLLGVQIGDKVCQDPTLLYCYTKTLQSRCSTTNTSISFSWL